MEKTKRVCFDEIVWLINVKMKMKNRSYRYDINRPRPRHGHRYTKPKNYRRIMVVICIKQHLKNI